MVVQDKGTSLAPAHDLAPASFWQPAKQGLLTGHCQPAAVARRPQISSQISPVALCNLSRLLHRTTCATSPIAGPLFCSPLALLLAMAPANGSSKPRKATAAAAAAGATPAPVVPVAATTNSKPAQKKAVVPALPLPYVKRQQAAAAASAAANANKTETKTDDARPNGKQNKSKDSKPRKEESSKAAAAEPALEATSKAANGSGKAFTAQAFLLNSLCFSSSIIVCIGLSLLC